MNKNRNKTLNKVKPVYPYLIIKRHWMKTLILGLVTFLLLYPFVLKSKKIYYETTGIIKVEPVLEETLKVDSNSILPYYEEFINTQLLKIVSDEVIKDSIKKIGIDSIIGFGKNAENKSITLFSKNGNINFKVEPISKTHYIKVIAKNENGQKLDVATNALLDSYIEKINSENSKIYEQKLKYLEEEKNKLEVIIDNNLILLESYVNRTGSGNFSTEDTPYSVQIKSFESAYVDIYKKRVENEKKYNEIVEMDKKIKDKFGGAKYEEDRNDNSYYVTRKMYLLEQIDKLNKEIGNYSSENPKRKELETKADGLFSEIKKLEQEKSENNKTISDYKMDYTVLNAYKDFQSTLKEEKQIAGELDKARNKYIDVSKQVLEAKELSENLYSDKASLEKIKERISEVKAESVTLNRIFVSEYASKTSTPAGSDLKKRLAVLFVLSFGWMAVLCFAYDIVDTRIKSVDDIQNSIGIKPSWPISNMLKGTFSTISITEPNSRINKAIRSLTVRLDKEREKHNAKIAVFTGVDNKCGITEIILNSAHMMSKNCGKVLLIELNFDNPSLQKKLEIEGAMGLKEILEGQELKDVVYFDKMRNIDVLFLDKTIALDNKDITTILKKAKNEYEFIYIDTEPVLSSDITEYLILKADIGILVVHGNRTKYSNMIHSVEILNRLELNSFGVVLNWGKTGKKR